MNRAIRRLPSPLPAFSFTITTTTNPATTMRAPFGAGRRFFNINLIPRRRPSATRVLRSLHTFYQRGDPNRDHGEGQRRRRSTLYGRVANAWRNTPIKWYPLPVGVGALLLAALQYKKQYHDQAGRPSEGHPDVPVKIKGPWQVHVLGALPLRNASRLWGYLNSFELPVWFRPFGFRLYASIFGCNLDEIEHSDLKTYKSLGDFFYRKLKDGVRPIAPASLVSPADGTVLHFGVIDNQNRIEQVKGLSYSVDALLGSHPTSPSEQVHFQPRAGADVVDAEFANVNGIEYSLGQLLGSETHQDENAGERGSKSGTHEMKDAATKPSDPIDSLSKQASVAANLGPASIPPLVRRSTGIMKEGNQLHFAVIYLAPGDYHRFHSPTAWVVERRRHFAGELFSVSPYIARRLANLFVLNERVALLGRWRYGFFGMVPVGATNVGSIKINFDSTLRTNLPARPAPPSPGTYAEATYASASPILQGQPLIAGQEVGGFSLGSTIVLVFEAPTGFEFDIQAGMKVKVGQALGNVPAS